MIILEQVRCDGEETYILNIDGQRFSLDNHFISAITDDPTMINDRVINGIIPNMELTIRLDRIDYREMSRSRMILKALEADDEK